MGKLKKVIDIIPPKNYADEDNEKTVQKPDAFSVGNIVNSLVAEPMSHQEELESLLNAEQDPIVELAKAGAVFTVAEETTTKMPFVLQRASLYERKSEAGDDFYQKIISHIHAPARSSVSTLSSFKISSIKPPIETKVSSTGFIVEEKIVDFYQDPSSKSPSLLVSKSPEIKISKVNFNFSPPKKKNFFKLFFLVLAVAGVFSYVLTLKNELVNDSSTALQNLEQAKEDLENFNFSKAAVSFQKSYNDFSQASQNLNLMGAGIAGIFADLPGVNKISSAKNIVEAGKLLASSGQAMSEALSALSKTGAILNPHDSHKTKPSAIIRQIKDALLVSTRNFEKAKALISDIDETVIPEDKRTIFLDFKDKLPMIEKILADAEDYTTFLEEIIGIDEPKKYLLLFQNYSELRPAGGFPGTYGVVSFASGGLSDFFVDDVYNLDGQLKKNIIPPKQLQHITPTLGMRDSAWFIDFPTSARKAMWFFSEEAGYKVNGVIAINPDIISQILKVVGPINMPEYKRTLTADNFLANIQEEVEYGDNRIQPKSIVVDFAPRLLEKLYSAGSADWTKIFNGLMASLEERDIMFYFDEKPLEEFAIDNGFAGEIKQTGGDYLAVNFSNIKGSKTDIVTDSSIIIDTRFEDGRVFHKVLIERKHNGGDQEHGFYNRQNPAYVRVLLPKDAEVLGISGNDLPNYRPLVNYGQLGFSNDQDIRSFESTFYFDKSLGVDKYEESGKMGIGFWMITDPGKTKKVEFEYSVPLTGKTCLTGLACSENYSFYFQKQPGMDWKNFKFTVRGSGDIKLEGSVPELNKIGDLYMLETELKKDLEVNINFKIPNDK